MDGKLELLFAHLSMNNIVHIRPLLLEAMDEYQKMCEGLTNEDRKKISFIKMLLWHAEREEWTLARECLKGAEAVYQDYWRKKMATEQRKPDRGYREIHGPPQITYPDKNSEQNLTLRLRGRIRTPVDLGSARPLHTPDGSVHSLFRSNGSTPRSQFGETSPRVCSLLDPLGNFAHGYPGRYNTDNAVPRTAANLDEKYRQSEGTDNQFSPRALTVAHAGDDDVTSIKQSLLHLYEREWRYALMSLKRQVVMEDKTLKLLVDILLEAYKVCEEEAQSQVLEFENAALKIITNGRYTEEERGAVHHIGNTSLMRQYRKNIAELSIRRLQDMFLTKILPVQLRKYEVKTDDIIDQYARACVYVTWNMVVQDPPFFLVDDRDFKDKDFNLKMYKPYSKVGRYMEYVVWPPLQLHKDGPLLNCGLAQGNGCT